MNRSHLRSLPNLPAVSPESPESVTAQAELAELFAGLLARGEREEEAPDYELLEAAVDGGLDPVETELFASRLAGDPVLQREFDDLVLLRDQLKHKVAGPRTASRTPPRLRRWLGYAAAAVLLAAVGVSLQPQPQRGESITATASAEQPGPQALFADSFEGGSTEHWSN